LFPQIAATSHPWVNEVRIQGMWPESTDTIPAGASRASTNKKGNLRTSKPLQHGRALGGATLQKNVVIGGHQDFFVRMRIANILESNVSLLVVCSTSFAACFLESTWKSWIGSR
jgi:hypothetical protein